MPRAADAVRSPIRFVVANMRAVYTHPEQYASPFAKFF
jgi:hypothetical protein